MWMKKFYSAHHISPYPSLKKTMPAYQMVPRIIAHVSVQPWQSIVMTTAPIENEIIILLEPMPSSIVQESALPASINCQPKQMIGTRLRVDQVEIGNNDCANSNCDNSKRLGWILGYVGLGWQIKGTQYETLWYTLLLIQFIPSFIIPAFLLIKNHV